VLGRARDHLIKLSGKVKEKVNPCLPTCSATV
jgi:hypothetical protein